MWQRIYPIKQSQMHTNKKGQGKSSSSYVKIICVWYGLNDYIKCNLKILIFIQTKEKDSLLTLIHVFCCL